MDLKKIFSRTELLELAIQKPLAAQIELTRNCNQGCIFCFRNCRQNSKYEDSSLSLWISALRKLKKIGVEMLNLSGGEILMYQQLNPFLKEAKKLDFYLLLNTNGTFDLSNYLTFLDEIVFSIHGIGKVHDKIVGKKGAFRLAEAALSSALKNGSKVGLSTVLVKQNFNKLDETYNYFSQNYPNISSYSFTLSIPSTYGRQFEDQRLILDEKKYKLYLRFLKKIPNNKRRLKHGMITFFNQNKDYFQKEGLPVNLPDCAAGKSKLIVAYNGDIYPCSYFLTDPFYCGNIFKEKIEKVWKEGKGFVLFRELMFEEKVAKKCKSCFKKERCLGGCKAHTHAYSTKGGLCNERDYRCLLGHAYLRG